MDSLSRLIKRQQAPNARNNTNIVVQRAAALRNINLNGNSSTNTNSDTQNNIRKRNKWSHIFSTNSFILVQNSTDESRKNKALYNSTQCSKANINDTSAIISMQKQIQSGTNTSINDNVKHNSQSINNKSNNMTINSNIKKNGRNMNDSAIQTVNTNNDINMTSGNNNNHDNDNHNNNNKNNVINLVNDSSNGVLLSRILSTENTNVNSNGVC